MGTTVVERVNEIYIQTFHRLILNGIKLGLNGMDWALSKHWFTMELRFPFFSGATYDSRGLSLPSWELKPISLFGWNTFE